MAKTLKKFISISVALAMVAVTPVTAFARDWYIDDGDITISVDEGGKQTVSQAGVTEEDYEIVIKTYSIDVEEFVGKGIIVETEGDSVAKFTLDEADIAMNYWVDGKPDSSAIDIGDSKAEITLVGNNTVSFEDGYDDDDDVKENGLKAAIHVSSGELTIKGGGSLNIYAETEGAKIGSNEYEDMSGTIHITDDVTIKADDCGSEDGAAIGSGSGGDFTGKIIIDGNAYVDVESNDRGAGIGAGEGDYYYSDYDAYYSDEYDEWGGDFRGEVIIGGNATVYTEGSDDSAGIGSGEDGTFSGGSITIKDNAIVHAKGDDEGPAIGAADDTPLDGDIIIKDNATVYLGYSDMGIGSEGDEGGDKGNIYIIGNASIYSEDEDDDIIIGGEYDDSFDGKIFISPTATIGGESGYNILLNGYAENSYINAKPGNLLPYIRGISEIISSGSSNGIGSGSDSGITDILPEETEESNPNTGAPVIMDAPAVVIVPVIANVKKDEE